MSESTPPRVLCVDDDPVVLTAARRILAGRPYDLDTASTALEALERLKAARYDVIVSDNDMPGMGGVELLRVVGTTYPTVQRLMLTGHISVAGAVDVMKSGALDVIIKPLEPARLVVAIENAVRARAQDREIARLQTGLHHAYASDQILGDSSDMQRLRRMISKSAGSRIPVLITGETGTGKELVARAIHFSGPRSESPFVAVNSAAGLDSLIDSDLFGHEKGAFTGAASQRRGHFEQAHGGTLFLDEIGDMPLGIQAKILRALQDGVVRPVGGERTIDTDVRIIAATNKDLPDAIESGAFRRDLFYRISTLNIELPPLRARRSEVAELTRHFVERACRRETRLSLTVAASTLQTLEHYRWPGNIRELEHVVDRAVLLCDGPEILPEHLPPTIVSEMSDVSTKETSPTAGLIDRVNAYERGLIQAALERHDWVKARAARDLQISERRIAYKMSGLGLQAPD